MTDSGLVRRCLKGNMESYRTLMNRYRGPAMAMALNILANYQEVFLKCSV
jgi:hypothetical protein